MKNSEATVVKVQPPRRGSRASYEKKSHSKY